MPAHEENPITYLTGDVTQPVGEGAKIIAHVCNNLGKWGKGFVLAVSRRWPIARQRYLTLHTPGTSIPLGTLQVVRVEEDVYIANLIAQDGIRSRNNPVPLKYLSLKRDHQKPGATKERAYKMMLHGRVIPRLNSQEM